MIGLHMGSVMCRNLCQPLAPSTVAASYSVRGTSCSAARKMTTAVPCRPHRNNDQARLGPLHAGEKGNDRLPQTSQNIVDHPVLVVVDEQPDHRRANRRDDGRDVENRPEGRPRDDLGIEQAGQQEGHRHAEGHADAHVENGVVNDGPEARVVGEDLREVAEADPDGRLDQIVPREAVVGRRQQGIQCPEQKPEQPRRDKHQARQQPAGFSLRHAPLACCGNCHFALPPTTLRLAHSMSARHLPGIRHSSIHRTRSAGMLISLIDKRS